MEIFHKKSAVGIDISDSSIELLGLSSRGQVLVHSRVNLDEGTIENGKILKKDILVEKLRELLKGAKPKPFEVTGPYVQAIVSLPESQTYLHLLDIPAETKTDDIHSAVTKAALSQVPFNLNELSWDYQIIDEGTQQRKYILFAGAKKEIVNDYNEVYLQAHIRPKVIDLESAALGRALLPDETHSPSMIIDIGARTTIVGIFDAARRLNFSININKAGVHFNKEIMKSLKVAELQAEEMKQKIGLDATRQDNKILPALQKVCQDIVAEVKDAIVYFEKGSSSKIENVILAGGSSLVPKIDEYFAANLEKTVTIGTPLDKIAFGSKSRGNEEITQILYATVVGLALRGVSDKKEGLNLIEQSKTEGDSTLKKLFAASFRSAMSHPQKKPLNETAEKKKKLKNAGIIVFFVATLFVLGFVVYTYVINPKPVDAPSNVVDDGAGVPRDAVEDVIRSVVILDTETGWLRVRKGPGTSFVELAKVIPGETYTLLGEEGDWYKIELEVEGEETEGWVFSDYIEIK